VSLLAGALDFISRLLSPEEGCGVAVCMCVQPGVGNTALVTWQGGSETGAVTRILVPSLGCSGVALPSLELLGRGGSSGNAGEKRTPAPMCPLPWLWEGGGGDVVSWVEMPGRVLSSHRRLCSACGGERNRGNRIETPVRPDQRSLLTAAFEHASY